MSVGFVARLLVRSGLHFTAILASFVGGALTVRTHVNYVGVVRCSNVPQRFPGERENAMAGP